MGGGGGGGRTHRTPNRQTSYSFDEVNPSVRYTSALLRFTFDRTRNTLSLVKLAQVISYYVLVMIGLNETNKVKMK